MKIPKVIIYVFLLIFGTGLFAYLDLKDVTMLYDDAYSIFMAKASYSEIISITSSDVHPPLYYILLKIFTSVFSDSLFSFRFFSTLGVIATLLLGCFPIRKILGDRIAVIFILLILFFPVSQYLATEIRMYSWTMFFVLLCGIYAYRVFSEGQISVWGIFLLSGICAAYLHNYGLLSVLGIYLILLISFIKQKKKWHQVLICGILFGLAYLPWLIRLIGQIENISTDYWIEPLTLNDLFLHIYYFYSPKEVWLPFADFSKVQMMVGLIVLMAVQLIITITVIYKGYRYKDKTLYLAIIALLAFLFPIIVGAIISVAYFPILVPRYMTCSFALYTLSMALIVDRAFIYLKHKWLIYAFAALMIVDGMIRYSSNLKYYHQTEIAYNQIHEFVRNGEQLVANDFSYHIMPRLQLIVPNNTFYILDSDSVNNNYEPFKFDGIVDRENLGDKFILVHNDRKAIQDEFQAFKASLAGKYRIIDSLQTSEIYLYRIERMEFPFIIY